MRHSIWILVLGLALTACQSGGPELGATMEEIEDDPGEFAGRQVVVSGAIDEVVSSTAFTIGGDEFGDDLLIVVPPGTDVTGARAEEPPYYEGDVVQIAGTVRQYDASELRDQQNVELTGDIEAEYQGTEPSVVAKQIYLTPRLIRAVDVEGAPAPIARVFTIFDAERPEELEGRRVHLENLTVQTVLSDSTFWVGEGTDQGIFVVLEETMRGQAAPEGRYDVAEGQTISLTGELTLLPSDDALQSRFQFDEQTMERLTDEGVYIRADSLSSVP